MNCVQLEMNPTASRYNLIQNGDFRISGSPPQHWTTTGTSGTDGVISLPNTVNPAPRLDNKVMQLNGTLTTAKKISQVIPVSGASGDSYVIGGWALADSVPLSGNNREFGIRLIFNNTDGTKTTTVAQFNCDTNSTANWQYSAAAAVAAKAYSSITVELAYDYNANTAYFDGIQLFKETFSQSYAYDPDTGNLTSVTDLQKQTTTYEYDTNNNLTKEILPTGAQLTYAYDNNHNVIQATTDTGVVYKFTYDNYGNNKTVEIVNGGTSIKSSAEYTDDFNRMHSSTDSTGKTTYYDYDANTNELKSVQYPEDNTATRTNYTYDSMYRMETAAATTDTGLALSANYTYTDDMLTKIQTGSTTYTFGYGNFALRSNVKAGNYELARYEYTDDQNNYLKKLVYGNGDSVQYTYDQQGRVTTQTYEDGDKLTYQYNNDGELARVSDSAGDINTFYYYDLLNRPVKTYSRNQGLRFTVEYGYDTLNNLSTLTEAFVGYTRVTNYGYDDDNRVSSISVYGDTTSYTYDALGRLSRRTTARSGTNRVHDIYQYHAPSTSSAGTTTGLVHKHQIDTASYDRTFTYTYDNNGNILTINDGTNTTSYAYDSANQLTRENNQAEGKTWTWTYDNAGNIQSKKEYAYTTGTLGAVLDTINYTYGDSSWCDLLTVYDGNTITYDGIGNPLSDGTWTYTWEHGRQLASMTNGTDTWRYDYDADGLRMYRTNNKITYWYTYTGDRLAQVMTADTILRFTYGADGRPLTFVVDGANYYYATNIQGDVVAILDNSGNELVSYTYDAWGKILSIDGTMKDTLGTLNPLRYRGYVYDQEYGLYYLQSRYYNPEIGRFLNADAFASTGQGLLGNNMFAYCNNNASNCSDSFGMRPVSILERFGDIAIPAPPLKVKTTKRDVTAEINSALNTKRMDAVHQRIANDLLFDMGYPQIGGLGGIVIELVEDAPLYIAYYNAVNHEEEWDIKRKDPWEKTIGTSYPGFGTEVLYEGNILTPEDLGNYTYGSIGKAYGFPLLILYAGSYYAAGFPVGEDFWNNEWKDWGYITKGYFG